MVLALLAIGTAAVLARHALRTHDAERHWAERADVRIGDFGTVDSLSVTVLSGPLPGANDELLTEPGLSLLLRMDDRTWLYDLGLSAHPERSTVVHNASLLEIELGQVQTVFLSHRHRDHMGGVAAERSGVLKLPGDTDEKPMLIAPPEALDMPGAAVLEVHAPAVLGEGIASLGPIRRALFAGAVDEQAFVVDVQGYGLVAVVGCGHQTWQRIDARTREVFGRPVRAVVGDLHFPVPHGRLQVAGIDAQRRLASGRGPFRPVQREDARAMLAWARDSGVKLLLVGHDTHDSVLGEPSVRRLEVGQTVRLYGPKPH